MRGSRSSGGRYDLFQPHSPSFLPLRIAADSHVCTKRVRAYLLHSTLLGTPLYGRQDIGCNCYSSGENTHVECIMPNAYKNMLAFFQLVHDLAGYEEKPLEVEMEDDGEADRVVKWEEVRDTEVLEEMGKALIEVSKE